MYHIFRGKCFIPAAIVSKLKENLLGDLPTRGKNKNPSVQDKNACGIFLIITAAQINTRSLPGPSDYNHSPHHSKVGEFAQRVYPIVAVFIKELVVDLTDAYVL